MTKQASCIALSLTFADEALARVYLRYYSEVTNDTKCFNESRMQGATSGNRYMSRALIVSRCAVYKCPHLSLSLEIETQCT